MIIVASHREFLLKRGAAYTVGVLTRFSLDYDASHEGRRELLSTAHIAIYLILMMGDDLRRTHPLFGTGCHQLNWRSSSGEIIFMKLDLLWF